MYNYVQYVYLIMATNYPTVLFLWHTILLIIILESMPTYKKAYCDEVCSTEMAVNTVFRALRVTDPYH